MFFYNLSLWIKASAKCINVNVINVTAVTVYNEYKYIKTICFKLLKKLLESVHFILIPVSLCDCVKGLSS